MPSWRRQSLLITGLILWAIVALFLAAIIQSVLFFALQRLGLFDSITSNTETIIQGISLYVIMFAVLVGVPWLTFGWRSSLELLGITRGIRWIDIGLALSGLVLYFVLATLVMWLVGVFVPQVNLTEAQETGITSPLGLERIFVFLLFVIIGPIMEELIFRGYLYGVLRKHGVSFILTTIIVSILFGAAHGQWNVGINVAVLSVMMCIGREITGTIWPAILIHMLKNGIAFYLLFVTPLVPGVQ